MSAPTSTELRLRESLDRAASGVDVDVQALYRATRAELRERRPSKVPRRWVVPAMAAAATVALVGTVVVGTTLDDRAQDRVASDAGGVADDFTCPVQATTTFGPGNDDDSFLPELGAGLRPRGEAEDAPTWEVERTDGGALLRIGNADGSLASVTTFEERDGGYEPVSVTKCSNESAPGSGPAPLVTEGLPTSRDDLTADDFAPGAVKVVDRLTYDTVGLARRHTVWAEPCEERLCLVAGRRNDTQTIATLRGEALVPADRSSQLADPDDVVGQDLGYTLVALHDRAGAVEFLSWESVDGATTRIDAVSRGGWTGQLFLFVAPSDDLASTTVHPREGAPRSYLPSELTD